jgi:hypothetical protein
VTAEIQPEVQMDCFVAALLAKTMERGCPSFNTVGGAQGLDLVFLRRDELRLVRVSDQNGRHGGRSSISEGSHSAAAIKTEGGPLSRLFPALVAFCPIAKSR